MVRGWNGPWKACSVSAIIPSGVEPWSFYFVNGFLNFNVVFLLAMAAVPLIEFQVNGLTWMLTVVGIICYI